MIKTGTHRCHVGASVAITFGSVCVAFAAVALIGCWNRTATSPPPSSEFARTSSTSARQEFLDDEILLDALISTPLSYVATENSEVQLGSPAFERVMQRGPQILPAICRRMRRPDLPFDHVVRYYSAANQLIKAGGLGPPVYWDGGTSTERSDGLIVIVPGGQDIEMLDDFKLSVTESVCARIGRQMASIADHSR